MKKLYRLHIQRKRKVNFRTPGGNFTRVCCRLVVAVVRHVMKQVGGNACV